jgi:uncharacterized membrane protein
MAEWEHDETDAQPVTLSKGESTFKGPFPHPSIMEKYQRLVPDFPERIMRQVEAEQQMNFRERETNIQLQARQVDIITERVRHNAHMAIARLAIVSLVIVITMICGTWLLLAGHAVAGGSMLALTVAALVGMGARNLLRQESSPS